MASVLRALWIFFVVVQTLDVVRFPETQDPKQPSKFRAGVDLITIEAHVVSRDGTPIESLRPDQFEVFIDGKRRDVTFADFVKTGNAPVSDAAGATSRDAPIRRIVVMAIDQATFPPSAQVSAREAATRVLKSVAPGDYLGLVAFPDGVAVAPTQDRAPLQAAISRISGLRADLVRSEFNISASEASALKSRDSVATNEITSRECSRRFLDPTCKQEVIQDGGRIADALAHQASQSISGLHGVIEALRQVEDRKTLLVISAGLPMRRGGMPDPEGETALLARRAAAANVNLYVLYMNVHFLRAFSAEYGKRNNTLFEDISMFGYGLEKFADGAGGTFFQIEVDSDPFVARALRETSAWYVLGVDARPEDRDGKDHFIRLNVKQRGATARYRRMVNIPPPDKKTGG
jgi:VWFA-related protein